MVVAKINGVPVTVRAYRRTNGVLECKVINLEYNYQNWVLATLIEVMEENYD